MSGITLEWCAHCNLEVKIPDDKASDCPVCGNEILPCGDCDEPGRNCDWTLKDRCHVYPRKKRGGHEENKISR